MQQRLRFFKKQFLFYVDIVDIWNVQNRILILFFQRLWQCHLCHICIQRERNIQPFASKVRKKGNCFNLMDLSTSRRSSFCKICKFWLFHSHVTLIAQNLIIVNVFRLNACILILYCWFYLRSIFIHLMGVASFNVLSLDVRI